MKQQYDDGQFSDRLQELIHREKLSNKDVAQALGVSQQAITNWIKTGRIDYENLRKLAALFQVNWVWLRYGPAALNDTIDTANDANSDNRRNHLDLLRQVAAVEEKHYHLLWLLDSIPLVVWELDRSGVFVFSEGHGLSVLGLASGEVVGRSLSDVYGDNKTIMYMHAKAKDLHQSFSEVQVDGHTWIAFTTPVVKEGEYGGTLGIAILKSSYT
jgi:transcriptional regulator with XRE-family HTH domain